MACGIRASKRVHLMMLSCLTPQWSLHDVPERMARMTALMASCLVARPVAAAIASIWRDNFDKQTISGAIDNSMKSIGLGMIVLAAIV